MLAEAVALRVAAVPADRVLLLAAATAVLAVGAAPPVAEVPEGVATPVPNVVTSLAATRVELVPAANKAVVLGWAPSCAGIAAGVARSVQAMTDALMHSWWAVQADTNLELST